uniref:Peptidase M15C domain-containing protein n=1 Tax=Plectus sambesii TaxID=2011161 RepID=A0A914W9G4_9BILA
MFLYAFVAIIAVTGAVYQEQKCASAGGTCSIGCTGGTTKSGLCPTQAANVLCCVKSAAPSTSTGSCALVTIAPSEFTGSALRVHNSFVPAINRINSYAKAAGVKIHITSSYRKDANVAGAIVVPATKSNHMVGHAIDMNVVYSAGTCNSACLGGKHPAQVATFISKVRADGELRWGGDFSTPDVVHIDDGFNLKNAKQWDEQYLDTQKNC